MSAAGLRKAAAVMASLHPADQAWLLDKFKPGCRHDLRTLIEQVEAMRVPHLEELRDEMRNHESDCIPQPPAPERLLGAMRGLSPAWRARVLAACAPDHLDFVAANSVPEEALAIRAEFLMLPQLPRKLSEALALIARTRGGSATQASGQGSN